MIRPGLKILLLLILQQYCFATYAQNNVIDSLEKVLATQKEDTNKVNTLNALSRGLISVEDNERAMLHAQAAISLAEKLHFKTGEGFAYKNIGLVYTNKKNYIEGIKNISTAINFFQEAGSKLGIAYCYLVIGIIYEAQYNGPQAINKYATALKIFNETGSVAGMAETYYFTGRTYYYSVVNYPEALKNFYASLKLWEQLGNKLEISHVLQCIGELYFFQDRYTEALDNFTASLKISEEILNKVGLAHSYQSIADISFKRGNYADALSKYFEALKIFKEMNMNGSAAFAYSGVAKIYEEQAAIATSNGDHITAESKLADALKTHFTSIEFAEKAGDIGGLTYYYAYTASVYIKLNDLVEAKKYADKSLQLSKELPTKDNFEKSYAALAELDSAQGNFKEAFNHYKIYISYRDSIVNEESAMKSLMHKTQYESEKNEALLQAKQAKINARQTRTRNLQYTAIAVFLLLAVFLYWNNRQKQKAKTKIETAYTELKSTQEQLIHSEKMASLGELTAGIAHEIQNPLNFVNNFSEVSKELLNEMKTELDNGNISDAKELAADVIQNLEKINHHGKRADAIVKGMLQHSRSSSGVKEPTDINALADEYLRLSYHGLRAKDKSFNATFKTDFDPSLKKINIVPQDIGRVILNLLTNAFYVVNEKKRLTANDPEAHYEPTVIISTKKTGNKVEIKVRDNGNGIPQKVLDKIFHPFFTTKPTGEETGLGLSLSYDIIKAHGGELKVSTKEGEFAEFVITLPI